MNDDQGAPGPGGGQPLEARLILQYLSIALGTAAVLTLLLCYQFVLPALEAAATERARQSSQFLGNFLRHELIQAREQLTESGHIREFEQFLPALRRAFAALDDGAPETAREQLEPIVAWLDHHYDLLPYVRSLEIQQGEQLLIEIGRDPMSTLTMHRVQDGRDETWTHPAAAARAQDDARRDIQPLAGVGRPGWLLRQTAGGAELLFRMPFPGTRPDQALPVALHSVVPIGHLSSVLQSVQAQQQTALVGLASPDLGLLLGNFVDTADGQPRPTDALLDDIDWPRLLAAGSSRNAGNVPQAVLRNWIFETEPVQLAGTDIWIVYLDRRPSLLGALHEFWIPLAWIAVALLSLALLVARRTARSIAIPLQQISHHSQRLGQGDYSEPEPVHTRIRELGRLIDEQYRTRELLHRQHEQLQADRDRLSDWAEESNQRWRDGQQDLMQRNQQLEKMVDLLRETEQKLSASQLRLNMALSAAGLGVWDWRPDTDTLHMDQRCADILQLSKDELPGSLVQALELVHSADQNLVLDTARQAAQGKSNHIQFNCRLRSGTNAIVHVDGKLSRTLDEGERQFTGTIRDISAEKAHEAKLEQARREAEEASQAMGNFLAMMSHEIRTPMYGILGHLELMALDQLTSTQREHLMTVQESANTLLLLINDILDFSKIRAGKMKIEITEVRPLQVIEGAMAAFGVAFAEKGLKLVLDVSPDIARNVYCDPLRLRQILSNLLSNALKFTDSGVVRLSVSILTDDADHQVVLIKVQDSGIGIPEDQLDRVMEAFAQADNSVTRSHGGTGLGLSICSQLTQLLGGDLRLESSVGSGTTAHLQMWWEKAPASEEPWSFESQRVLFVGLPAEIRDPLLAWSDKMRLEVSALNTLPTDFASIGMRARAARACAIVMFIDRLLKDGDLRRSELAHLVRAFDMPVILIDQLPGQPTVLNKSGNLIMRLPGAPLLPSHFLRSVRACVTRDAVEAWFTSETKVQQIERAFSLEQCMPVLLAEDHPTNQQLIKQQLAVLGLDCQVFADGQQALEAWRNGEFSLILTDCHMPVMDGYALARRIREEEQLQQETPHIPIIALTADAVGEVRDDCLRAGMDDYLSKPTTVQQLSNMLAKWVPGDRQNRPVASNEDPSTAADSPLDMQYLLDSFMDEKMVKMMLRDYLRTNRQDVEKLFAAIEQDDLKTVREFSHRLKGAARIVGAGQLAEHSQQLEQAARDRDTDQLKSLLPGLRSQIHAVTQYIEAYL